MHGQQGQFNRDIFSRRSKVKIMTKVITFSSHLCSSVFFAENEIIHIQSCMYAQEKEGTGIKAENPTISTPILLPLDARTGRNGFILIGGY